MSPVDPHDLPRKLDLTRVLDALQGGGHLNPVQAADVVQRERVQRMQVLRQKDRVNLRAGAPTYKVSPIELVASFELMSQEGTASTKTA